MIDTMCHQDCFLPGYYVSVDVVTVLRLHELNMDYFMDHWRGAINVS